MPRWLKVLGIAIALLAALVVVLLLVNDDGDGGHRPRRHGLAASQDIDGGRP